ncbi:GatB/YqeY domain-containing protein, partial [Patescibacteria group bacterium]|nr:GatB/YqeY domain-containing protein [Patescibacteria group bacterium]MBU1448592.1 GatB/YqeY domain-containing protein [Patescibacteria group bacterium]
MTLIERIESDLKEAMKAKEELTLSTLRLMRSALTNKRIELMHDLTEEDVVSVLRSMVKQYRDALVDFTAGGRQDLVDHQQAEIAIIERYLPAAMPEAELEAICRRVVEESGATAKDMGKVMG